MSSQKKASIDWNRVADLVSSGKVADEYVEESVIRLSELVCNKYFGYYNVSFREELVREGVYKAYQLFQAPHIRFDLPLKPFLSAGMRNIMTHFIYKNCKEVEMPEFVGDYEIPDTDNNVWESFSLDYSLVVSVFSRFPKDYLKYQAHVLYLLEDMGFRLLDVPVVLRQWADNNHDEMVNFSKTLSQRFICLVVHEMMESSSR